MDAVGANPDRQTGVLRDQQMQTAFAADRRQPERQGVPARVAVVTEDDGAAAGQRLDDGDRVCQPLAVGHQDQRRQRGIGDTRFEPPREVC